MKYVQPYGVTDPNAHYINGDPSQGIQGSIPPAAAFENPMREIINVITNNGIIPNDGDLAQMFEGIRSQFSNYCVDTGSVDTLSVALSPPLTKYTIGLPLRVRVANTNNAACTIDAGCGRTYIRRPDGSNVLPNDLPAGGIVDLVFDGAGFQMVNYLGGASAGDIINNYSNIPFTVDTSTVANTITAPFTPAITTMKAGDVFLVQVANTVTGPTQMAVNALSARPVKAMGGGDLLPGDLNNGDVKLFVFDGLDFQVEPNVLMNVSATVQVPTTYPTAASALLAFNRKRISTTATLTVLIGISVIGPIKINHPDADRIVIKGTMKAAAPTYGDMILTGADQAHQDSDAATNLPMLRGRYGTEIQVGSGHNCGIANQGPGMPLVQDILITGAYSTGGGGAGDGSHGVNVTGPRAILCSNICTWGMGWSGYTTLQNDDDTPAKMHGNGGTIAMINCIGCHGWNGCCAARGIIVMIGGFLVSHVASGVNADGFATWTGQNVIATYNRGAGVYPFAMGYSAVDHCYIVANGVDLAAFANSLVLVWFTTYGSASPPVNYVGGGMNSAIFLYGA